MPVAAESAEDVALPLPGPLAERLGDPSVVAGLTTLLDHLDVVVLAVNAIDGLLAHSETILDSAVDSAGDARTMVQSNPHLSAIDWPKTLDATARLVAALPEMAPALLRGAESGAIEQLTSPPLVEMLHLASAGIESALEAPAPVKVSNLRSTLKALKDPDIQRGASLFMTIAREIGKQLSHGK